MSLNPVYGTRESTTRQLDTQNYHFTSAIFNSPRERKRQTDRQKDRERERATAHPQRAESHPQSLSYRQHTHIHIFALHKAAHAFCMAEPVRGHSDWFCIEKSSWEKKKRKRKREQCPIHPYKRKLSTHIHPDRSMHTHSHTINHQSHSIFSRGDQHVTHRV